MSAAFVCLFPNPGPPPGRAAKRCMFFEHDLRSFFKCQELEQDTDLRNSKTKDLVMKSFGDVTRSPRAMQTPKEEEVLLNH